MAPGAAIALVLAKSDDDADIISATRYAVDHDLGDVISQSFGEGEACMTSANLDRAARGSSSMRTRRASPSSPHRAITAPLSPAALPTAPDFKSASTPASDPLVTGVGGTNLQADKLGQLHLRARLGRCVHHRRTRATPSATRRAPPAAAAAGSAHCSSGRHTRATSSRIPSTARGVPDVAYNAGVDGGVLVHWGVGNTLFGLDPTDPTIYFLFGGTSAGSPAWSALVAIADQAAGHRLGNINPLLYSTAGTIGTRPIRDVTRGNNNFDDVVGFDAGPGWDPVTGLGSPDAQILVNALATGTKPPRGKP